MQLPDFIRRRPVASLICLGAALLFIGAAAFAFLDAPPPDDTDLRALAEECDVEAGDGSSIANFLPNDSFEVELDRAEQERLDLMIAGEEAVDEDFLHGLLVKLDAAPSVARDFARSRDWRLPDGVQSARAHEALDTATGAASVLLDVARIRGTLGEWDAALADIRLAAHISQHIQAGRASHDRLLTCGGINLVATDILARSLADHDAGQLRRASAILQGSAVSRTFTRRAIAAHYTAFVKTVLDRGRRERRLGDDDAPWTDRLFKPNATARLLKRAARESIANVGKPLNQHDTSAQDEIDAAAEDRFSTVISGNGAGLKIAAAAAIRSILRTLAIVECRRALTHTAAAARLHELERGALPASLSDLVPAYLDEVPMDPFDGNPLRYDPVRRRVIWSAGDDFRDAGGSPPASMRIHQWMDNTEPTILIPGDK